MGKIIVGFLAGAGIGLLVNEITKGIFGLRIAYEEEKLEVERQYVTRMRQEIQEVLEPHKPYDYVGVIVDSDDLDDDVEDSDDLDDDVEEPLTREELEEDILETHKPHELAVEEFDLNELEYDQACWSYFAPSRRLVDDFNQTIRGRNRFVGTACDRMDKDDTIESIYIRCPELQLDIEISRVPYPYEESAGYERIEKQRSIAARRRKEQIENAD